MSSSANFFRPASPNLLNRWFISAVCDNSDITRWWRHQQTLTRFSPCAIIASMSSSVISLSLDANTWFAPCRIILNISSLPSFWPWSTRRPTKSKLIPLGGVEVVSTLLNDDIVELELHLCSFDDPLFNCILCDQPEDFHLLLLSDSMSSILGCKDYLWDFRNKRVLSTLDH